MLQINPLIAYLAERIFVASHLTTWDRALIEAQWFCSADKDFQCTEKAADESRRHGIPYEQAIARVRARGRCDSRLLETPSGFTFRKCFCNFEHPQFASYLGMWTAYKRGILPYAGAWADQPAWVFEVFELLDHLQHTSEQREQARAETARKAQQRATPQRR